MLTSSLVAPLTALEIGFATIKSLISTEAQVYMLRLPIQISKNVS